MTKNLPLQTYRGVERKVPAPVIPISAGVSLAEKKKKPVSPDAEKKQVPQFYTAPIFRAKEYDFL